MTTVSSKLRPLMAVFGRAANQQSCASIRPRTTISNGRSHRLSSMASTRTCFGAESKTGAPGSAGRWPASPGSRAWRRGMRAGRPRSRRRPTPRLVPSRPRAGDRRVAHFHASVFSAIANYLVLRLTETDAKALVRNVADSRQERSLADRIKQMDRFRRCTSARASDAQVVRTSFRSSPLVFGAFTSGTASCPINDQVQAEEADRSE